LFVKPYEHFHTRNGVRATAIALSTVQALRDVKAYIENWLGFWAWRGMC
jgi:hypothetical protein